MPTKGGAKIVISEGCASCGRPRFGPTITESQFRAGDPTHMNHRRKDNRQHRSEFPTVENLRDFTEAVEVVRDFLIADTPQKVRLGLIILDNTAELLMAQICREIFEHDEFRAKVIRPRLGRKLKQQTLEYFQPKTALMKSEGIISEGEAALLDLGHSYRNPAFHQGHHNPRSLRVISIMLLRPLSTLFQKAFAGVSEGGMAEIAWLRQYGVSTAPLAFGHAAAQIMSQIAGELYEPLCSIKKTLCSDISGRLDNLDRLLGDEWYSLTPEQWDDVLRHVQFLENFDDEAASAEYRKFVYQITDQVGSRTDEEIRNREPMDAGSGEAFARADRDYKVRRAKALAAFHPALQLSELSHIRAEIAGIGTAGSESDVVMPYQELDQRLTRMEDLLLGAQQLVEESI
jgi:hypothetical protein